MTWLFPKSKTLTIPYPYDTVTHAAEDLTDILLHPTPSRPIPHIGNKQTEALRQLTQIFNTEVPQIIKPLPEQLSRLDKLAAPLHRVEIQQPYYITPSNPHPNTNQSARYYDSILITPGYTKITPPQKVPHITPNDTEVINKAPSQLDDYPRHVPKVHRYNTRVGDLKGHAIMANNVTTITLPLKNPIPAPSTITTSQTGEYWSIRYTNTGEFTIQPGQMNASICPDTVKVQ